MIQIIFNKADWDRLTEYLLRRSDVETGAYAISKTTNCNGMTKILVKQVLIPLDSNYYKRSSAAVAFKPEFTEYAFQTCEKINGHLLDIHTHPWSDNVNFSSIDYREANDTKIPYLRKYLPKTMIAFLVFGDSETMLSGWSWNKGKNRLENVHRIIIL